MVDFESVFAGILCKNFCAYFKPSKKEDLACEGFVVIGRLLSKGKNIAFDRPAKACDYRMQGYSRRPYAWFVLFMRMTVISFCRTVSCLQWKGAGKHLPPAEGLFFFPSS